MAIFFKVNRYKLSMEALGKPVTEYGSSSRSKRKRTQSLARPSPLFQIINSTLLSHSRAVASTILSVLGSFCGWNSKRKIEIVFGHRTVGTILYIYYIPIPLLLFKDGELQAINIWENVPWCKPIRIRNKPKNPIPLHHLWLLLFLCFYFFYLLFLRSIWYTLLRIQSEMVRWKSFPDPQARGL